MVVIRSSCYVIFTYMVLVLLFCDCCAVVIGLLTVVFIRLLNGCNLVVFLFLFG